MNKRKRKPKNDEKKVLHKVVKTIKELTHKMAKTQADVDALIQTVLSAVQSLNTKIDSIPKGTAVDTTPTVEALTEINDNVTQATAKVDALISPPTA